MYGRKYMGTARITYVIDEKGIITEVIEKVDTKNHAEQILGGKTTATPKPAKTKKVAVKKVVKPVKKAAKKVKKK
jgi:peroxiredoxin Q/BCP